MMGTTSALRRSNEQEFSTLFRIVVDTSVGRSPTSIPAQLASPIRDQGITQLGLFGPKPAGNGPTYLACRLTAELTLFFLGCYQDDFFMPIKGPRDANPRKTIREILKNLYTERGRPVEIHRFLTRAKELFLGNLDNL